MLRPLGPQSSRLAPAGLAALCLHTPLRRRHICAHTCAAGPVLARVQSVTRTPCQRCSGPAVKPRCACRGSLFRLAPCYTSYHYAALSLFPLPSIWQLQRTWTCPLCPSGSAELPTRVCEGPRPAAGGPHFLVVPPGPSNSRRASAGRTARAACAQPGSPTAAAAA